MNNLKELLAKASRKCEMRWKVLVFDPNKDNELIDEFKDFECIDCATAKKRELLEKYPDKTIEIVSESISRKTEAGKEIKVGNQRFYTTNDNGVILVRKIAPYDDADYYYAVYDPQKVRLVFTQSGGKNKQASMVKYNDTTKQLEEIAKKLIELNKHVQPKMVHESISRKTEERVFSKVVGVKDIDSAIKILKERIGIDYFGFKQSKEKTDGNAVFAFSKKYNIPHKVARFNPNKMTMDILVESAQKNESYTIQNVKTRTDAEKIIKDKCKPKDFRFTDIGIAYDGKKSIAQYMPNSNQLVIFESVTKANYNEIVKVLSDTIAKAAKKYPEAKLVKNYQATTGSHGAFLDEGLHFTGKDALSKALAVSEELQKAMSKYGFKNDIGGRLPYMIGNNYYSTIVTFGSIPQGSNGASVGYTYMKDALKFLESAQKNEAVNINKVKQDVENAVKKYFKNDKDVLEYVYIDSKKDRHGRNTIEVRAELSYNGMVNLADYLDKVVQKYDRYAYFDQETSGIMTAVFESAQMNEKHLLKKGDRVIAYGDKGTIYSVGYVDPAQTTKLFKVLMDGTKKIEKFREPELRFIESSQKSEDFYKYIDDVPTREIAKALKELGIKEPYATQKAKIADKLAKHFGLRSAPTPIEMTKVLNALPYFAESSQMSETRGYRVLVELGVPDNMNNRDIENEVERLLRASHKIDVVLDVTAERR